MFFFLSFLSRFASSVLRHKAYYAIYSCSIDLVYYGQWAYNRYTFQYVLLLRMLYMLYLTIDQCIRSTICHIYATSAHIRSSLFLLLIGNYIMPKNIILIYVPFHNN